MEVYFNPIRIEYLRDLMNQAMGMSNKATHSLYGIKNAAMAISYSDGDGDLAAIEQHLEQLSILYRKHYDFLDKATHQYLNAENNNIDILSEILREFDHLHTDIDFLNLGQFDTARFDATNALVIVEQNQGVLIPVSLNAFSSISKPNITSAAESILTPNSSDKFIELYTACFSENNVNIESSSSLMSVIVNPVQLLPIDDQYRDLPIRPLPTELTGLLLPGIFVSIIARNSNEFETLFTLRPTEGISLAKSSIDANTLSQQSLQGLKGDMITLMPSNSQGTTLMNATILEDTPKTVNYDTHKTIFKTIEDFFSYLNRVEYLFDNTSMQMPSVTNLQDLSISSTIFTLDLPADLVSISVGGYEKLEDILLFKNNVTIQEIPSGGGQGFETLFTIRPTEEISLAKSSVDVNISSQQSLQGLIKGNMVTPMTYNSQDATLMDAVILEDAPNVVDITQKTIFKTIEDFFIYLTRVEYLFDNVGIQLPSVTYLQELSISSPAFTLDIPSDLVSRSVGSYQNLEDILLFKNNVAIQKVPVGVFQEYAHIWPLKFGSGNYNNLDAPLQNMDSQLDYNSVPVGTDLPLYNDIYVLDVQKETDYVNQNVITGQYHAISRLLRDNFDEELALPIVKTSQYSDVGDIEKAPIYPVIFPGIRMTDEMSISSLEIVNVENPVVYKAAQLEEQTIDMLTIIDDDSNLLQIPKVNITGYSSMQEGDLWNFKFKHSVYDSVYPMSINLDELTEVSSAQSGSFATILPITEEQDGDRAIIQQRMTSHYMDVEKLDLDKQHSTIIQIPKVNITEYSSMQEGDLWNFKFKHSVYDSMYPMSINLDELVEVSSAQSGSFATILPITEEQDGDRAIIQQRTTSPYMDVDQLNLVRQHSTIKDVVVTDYARIEAFNKLDVIKEAIRNGNIDDYIDKYENGVDGLAADIAQALKVTEINMDNIDTFLHGLVETLLVRVKEEYINIESEKIPIGSQQSTEETLQLNYQYDLNGNVRLHGYTPQVLTGGLDIYEDLDLQVYSSDEKVNTYNTSVNIDTDIKDTELYNYIKSEIDELTLYTYTPDNIPSTTINNEGEALITNISQQTEADIQISITKRLELWLKWLFEMSMKNFNGSNAEELVSTVRRLKQMVIDEPVFLDATTKSIKHFVENLDWLLSNYGADAQSVVAYSDLSTLMSGSQG